MKILILILIFAVLVSGCIQQNITDKYSCQTNEDCMPEQCCHPTSCINKAFQPNCSGIACTMECRPETMDCGQGSCACIDSHCEALLRMTIE